MEKLKCTKGCIGTMSKDTMNDVFMLIEKFGHRKKDVRFLPNGQKTVDNPTHVDFYGGEPMMVFDTVKYFIEESKRRGMNLDFALLTNGTLGTQEQFDYLRSQRCWVQRSIDGHPEAQEKYRPNSVDKYIEITKIARDFKDSRRMTIQPEFAKDILKSLYWFEEHGFTKGISPMPNYYAEWTDEHIEDFKRSLWALATYYVQKWKEGEPFYVFYFSYECQARFMNQINFGCGGASNLHCVSWDGWVYMCHRFSKEPHDSKFCYGHIKDVLNGTAKGYGEDVEERVRQFKTKAEVYWNEECRYCIAQKACDKGCIHTNNMCTGTLNQPPKLWCRIRQETVKVVDWIDAQLRPIDPQWWARGNTTRGSGEFLRKRGHNCKYCGRRSSC
jgi:uncharacterized protein